MIDAFVRDRGLFQEVELLSLYIPYFWDPDVRVPRNISLRRKYTGRETSYLFRTYAGTISLHSHIDASSSNVLISFEDRMTYNDPSKTTRDCI
jgi:hypothetical protein